MLAAVRAVVTLPVIFNWFQPFNFSRYALNAVAVDDGTRVGIANALRGVILSQNELQVCLSCLFGIECDAIQ
jgi:hypothetical protein